MGDLMPDTTPPAADPYGLMHWVSAMREAGDLAPMLVVVRAGAVIASGFIDPSAWGASMGIALYGFGADAVAGVMDSWVWTAPDLGAVLDRTPQQAFEAGDPNAAEALQVMWVPRAGDVVSLSRPYVATDDGITWHKLIEWAMVANRYVEPSGVQRAIDRMGTLYPHDEFADVPEADRDRATAKYLGLELR